MTKFENLPNELLLDIFKYCRPEDLFISLMNLNKRLNTLIYIQPLNIDLSDIIPKYLLDRYYKSILFHAREEIQSLRLSDTYGRMSRFVTNDNQIEMNFEIRKYILHQIKSLILWEPAATHLQQILTYVNNLEYLHVTLIGKSEYTPNYTHGLLKSLFEMISLKRLCLEIYDSIEIDDNIGTSISLTHVTLYSCYMEDLASLLRRMPNIRKLIIRCYNRSFDQQSFDYSLYDKLADCIPYLTNLNLDFIYIPFEKVEVLLQQLPRLIKLTLTSSTIENYSNGYKWERIINSYLPYLQKFNLFINETDIRENIDTDLNEILQSFNSFFWHRWPVVIEYYIEEIDKKHLKLYTLPVQGDSLRTYFYGVQILETINEFNLNYNKDMEKLYYKKLDELRFVLRENPPSKNLLPNRIYSNLKALSFSSQLIDSRSYETDNILIDLQQICSISILSNIERIYLYDHIYPTNFLSQLLNLLPNIVDLRAPASSFDILASKPLIISLTIDFNSTIKCYSTDVLRQISIYFPNIYFLYFELTNPEDIYILLSYCLRKFSYLSNIKIKLHQINVRINQQAFILWFDDFKQLNGLNDEAQVEFNE